MLGWNNHALTTEHNKTPMQLYTCSILFGNIDSLSIPSEFSFNSEWLHLPSVVMPDTICSFLHTLSRSSLEEIINYVRKYIPHHWKVLSKYPICGIFITLRLVSSYTFYFLHFSIISLIYMYFNFLCWYNVQCSKIIIT